MESIPGLHKRLKIRALASAGEGGTAEARSAPERAPAARGRRLPALQGCYSETGFQYIDMDRNFVRVYGADTIAIDLTLSALIS